MEEREDQCLGVGQDRSDAALRLVVVLPRIDHLLPYNTRDSGCIGGWTTGRSGRDSMNFKSQPIGE